jgi:hypothetical protein
MTKDEALKLAREAGFVTLSINEDKWGPYLERFAELVRADERDKWMERTAILIRGEREACAMVCDEMEEKAEGTECCKWPTPIDCADAIRARGKA